MPYSFIHQQDLPKGEEGVDRIGRGVPYPTGKWKAERLDQLWELAKVLSRSGPFDPTEFVQLGLVLIRPVS